MKWPARVIFESLVTVQFSELLKSNWGSFLAGGSQRLVHLVGYGRAMEMMMTGNNVSAEDAYRMGIVNHLCTLMN